MSRALTLTGAFHQHVIDMRPGATLTTADAAKWVASNLEALGSDGQTQHTAEASCHCASQRLITDDWLVRIADRNLYERTEKPAPKPWD
jgi:hypothetical protein